MIQIRRQSPADLAGLKENDVVLAINNYSTRGLNRSYAIDVINTSEYVLDLVIQRYSKIIAFKSVEKYIFSIMLSVIR